MPSIQERIKDKLNQTPELSQQIYVYSKGEVVWSGQGNEFSIPKEFLGFTYEIVKDSVKHKLALQTYHKELELLYKEAYDNIEEYMGWEDIDKEIVNWIKHKAYEESHAHGYHQVLMSAEDYDSFVDIIRKKQNASSN